MGFRRAHGLQPPTWINLDFSKFVHIGQFFLNFAEVMHARKDRWISVKVSEKIAETVKVVASTMGISVSEFTRQAILEKLQQMNLVSTQVKAALTQEVVE
jgi:predicted DNA binding CopG/RHH family protein